MGFGRFHHMMSLKEEKPVNTGAVLKRLAVYLHPFRWPLLIILVLVLVSTSMRLVNPYLLGLAVDRFIIAGDKAGLVRLMLLLVAVGVTSWTATVSESYLMTVVGQRILARMRTQIFEQVQALSLSFFDKHEAGDLMSRLVNDVEVIGHTLNVGLVRMIGDVLILVGIMAVMLRLSPRLALASYAVIPIMIVTTFFFSKRARAAFRRTREKIGKVSSELEENISGVRVVQAFSRERANQMRFAQINAENRDANVQAVGILSAFSPTLDILSTAALALVAGYGAYLVLQDLVTIGIVVLSLIHISEPTRPY